MGAKYDLQKTINEIKMNKYEHVYKISLKIEKQDGTFIHTEEEKDSLDEINVKFQKSFNFKEEIISLGYYYTEFGNLYLNKLSKVGWEQIVELKLNNNNITDIEPLYNMQLIFLEKLDLSNNDISDIDDIGKLQILNLKYIHLNNNQIDSPFAFYDEKFSNLEFLNLLENKIDERDKSKFKTKYLSKHKNKNLILNI